MLKLGEKQTLIIGRRTTFGVYLREASDKDSNKDLPPSSSLNMP